MLAAPRAWIPLPSLVPSGSPSRFPEALFAAHSDLDLLEATPGIEPGIAVLQVPRIRPGVSAKVRPEIKNGTR